MKNAHHLDSSAQQLSLFEPTAPPESLERARALHGIAKVRQGLTMGSKLAS
jgi:hypothetical protein